MATKTFDEIGVLGLYTETPLHCGSEGDTGYVDLPIQRERHTSYPVIPGSTLKGVLRDEMDEERMDRAAHGAIFGTYNETTKDTTPGSVSFGDGILVAFPVRSSEAPFHWVTCPFVLERAFRAMGKRIKVPPPPAPRAAWAAVDGGDVVLEELRLSRKADAAFFAHTGSGLEALLSLLPKEDRGFGYTRELFAQRLLIVSDADFKLLVETATEVLTRIKLNALGTTTNLERKDHPELEGVRDYDLQGNLFVEEVLPPEVLFLASLRGAERWRGALVDGLKGSPVIRLGGDETIGRGVTHLTLAEKGA